MSQQNETPEMLPEEELPEETPEKRTHPLPALLSMILVIFCLALVGVLLPAHTAQTTTPAPGLEDRFSRENTDLVSRALEGYAYIHKHYRIPEGGVPAKPLESGYGESADPAVILSVLEQASDLLGGETAVGWTPETQLRPGTTVQYYYDETILVLTWQELDQGRVCTWCEVKLADVSQLRRKLAGDKYGYSVQIPASWLAAQDNAVAAVSGDFYAFRTAGIHVYNGTLYFVSGDNADTCFFDRNGDMLVVHRNEINSWEEASAFVKDHGVIFSVAFGPSILEDGVINVPLHYPWGENYESYARAAISQVGELHYLFLAANRGDWSPLHFITPEIAQLMLDHGCTMAYCLDGGQTAEVLFHGELRNVPEFGRERVVSDVLCFASALPEGDIS